MLKALDKSNNTHSACLLVSIALYISVVIRSMASWELY